MKPHKFLPWKARVKFYFREYRGEKHLDGVHTVTICSHCSWESTHPSHN